MVGIEPGEHMTTIVSCDQNPASSTCETGGRLRAELVGFGAVEVIAVTALGGSVVAADTTVVGSGVTLGSATTTLEDPLTSTAISALTGVCGAGVRARTIAATAKRMKAGTMAMTNMRRRGG